MTSEYRKVSVKLPKNRRFRSVDHTSKLVYYYAISNPLSNSAGCYEINPAEIGFDLGLDDRSIYRAIEALTGSGLLSWDADNEVLLVERALKHWPITNIKHAAGAISRLLELPDCPLRSRRIAELLEQEKLSEEQQKNLQKVLGNLVEPDSPIIALSPSRPKPRPKSKPELDLEQTPLKPPQGGECISNPESSVLEGEVLSAGNGGAVVKPSPLPAKNQNFPEAVILWNEMVEKSNNETGSEFKPVQIFTPQREAQLNARLKECDGIEGWRTAVEKVSTAPWLRGDVGDWKATFDWVIKKQNFLKIMENQYDKRTNKPTTNDSFRDAIADC